MISTLRAHGALFLQSTTLAVLLLSACTREQKPRLESVSKDLKATDTVSTPPSKAQTNSTKQTLRTAPAFSLNDHSGNPYSLKNFKGKWVVLHFWAAWCPPCQSEISEWIEFASRFNEKPIQFIAISLDPNWEAIEKLLPNSKIPKGIFSLIDPSAKTSDAYGSFQFPETYLINPDQKIVTKWVGPQTWSDPQVVDFFSKLLQI